MDAAPSLPALRETALSYLARRAASTKQVRAALERKIATWVRRATKEGVADAEEQADGARAHIATVVEELARARLLDDAKFAAARARRLAESGKSRRAILVHLASKGIDGELARESAPVSADGELEAALRFARKRRIGPFSREALTRELRHKALGALSRAGFDRYACERIIDLSLEEAEARLGHRGGW